MLGEVDRLVGVVGRGEVGLGGEEDIVGDAE